MADPTFGIDTADLAKQAGVLPDADGTLQTGDSHPNLAEGGGWIPGVTMQNLYDSGIIKGYDANQGIPGYNAPITSPTQVSNVNTTQPTATQEPINFKTGEGLKVAQQKAGYSPQANAAIRGGPGAVLDARLKAMQEEGRKEWEPVIEMQQKAADEGRAAIIKGAFLESQKAKAMGEENAKLFSAQKDFYNKEQEAYVKAQAESSQVREDYLSTLQELRGMRVDPGQFWNNLSKGDQFGTLVSAFVSDFLGAKGIKTSAMQTLHDAIDRNIEGQLQAIKNKEQVAEGFKSLWWVQRAQAASDAEARQRMKGIYIDMFKAGVEAHMAQFDSPLATVNGQAALAKLDTELAKNTAGIFKDRDMLINQRMGQEVQRYGDELKASAENYRTATEWKIAQAKMDQKKDIYSGLLFDTSKSGKGQARWEFNADVKPEDQFKSKERFGKALALQDDIEEYRSLLREYGNLSIKGDIPGMSRFLDTHDAQMKAVQSRILENHALAISGKAVSDTERELLQKETPEARWGTKAHVEEVVANFEQREGRQLAHEFRQIVHELPKDDVRRSLVSNDWRAGEAENIDARNTANPPAPSAEDITYEHQAGAITSPGAGEKATYAGAPAREDFKEFMKQHPDMARGPAAEHIENNTRAGFGSSPDELKMAREADLKTAEPTNATQTMTQMRLDVEKILREKPERAEGKDRPKALDQLASTASGYFEGAGQNDTTSAYAAFMLSKISEDTGISFATLYGGTPAGEPGVGSTQEVQRDEAPRKR